MNKTKTNKGITLVALVITIIVLIILAGVSINAVMNNGLIENSKEARTKYNDEKVKEEKAISELSAQVTDINFENHFAKNNVQYKINNAYLTGVFGQTVGTVEATFPEGYTLCDKDGKDTLADSAKVGTGMAIVKDNEIVGRILIYGDLNGDGYVESADVSPYITIKTTGKGEDYQKIALDLNFDGIVNNEDYTIFDRVTGGGSPSADSLQTHIAGNPYQIIVYSQNDAIERYMASLSNSFKSSAYKFEWNSEWETYLLTGANATTYVETLLALLPTGTVIKSGRTEVATGNNVKNEDSIWFYDEYYKGDILIGEISF